MTRFTSKEYDSKGGVLLKQWIAKSKTDRDAIRASLSRLEIPFTEDCLDGPLFALDMTGFFSGSFLTSREVHEQINLVFSPEDLKDFSVVMTVFFMDERWKLGQALGLQTPKASARIAYAAA